MSFRLYMVPSVVEVRDELPRSPNGKFDRALLRQEIAAMSVHPTIAAFDVVDGQLAVGGIPVERLAERVGSTPFFAYDRRLLTERVATLRAALPSGVDLSYAVKANPMPAVVQHLAGLVDSFDVASAGELRTGARHAYPTRARQLRRAGQDACRSSARRSQRA